MKSIRVVISGLVQGVGFRAWLSREAMGSNLHGWVRNIRGGKIEAVLAGDRRAVRRILELCWTGPHAATVTDVASQKTTAPDEEGFQILNSL